MSEQPDGQSKGREDNAAATDEANGSGDLGEAVEVWRGSVAMWECDAMGHLNVGFYVAKSVEGLAALAAELGMPGAFAADARATLIVREQHIRFLREARP